MFMQYTCQFTAIHPSFKNLINEFLKEKHFLKYYSTFDYLKVMESDEEMPKIELQKPVRIFCLFDLIMLMQCI